MRTDHTFEFTAVEIRDAAKAKAEYHEERLSHWQARAEDELKVVKDTVSAKVVESEMTDGKQVYVAVEYGDQTAWNEYQLAYQKTNEHRKKAKQYRIDEKMYGSQYDDKRYLLDTADIQYFGLGDEVA